MAVKNFNPESIPKNPLSLQRLQRRRNKAQPRRQIRSQRPHPIHPQPTLHRHRHIALWYPILDLLNQPQRQPRVEHVRDAKQESERVPRFGGVNFLEELLMWRPRRRQQVENGEKVSGRVAEDDDPAPAEAAAGPPGGEVGVCAGAEGRVRPGAEDEVLV